MDKVREAELWSSLSYRKRAEITTASLLYLLDLIPFPALRDWELEGWLREHGLVKLEFETDFMTIFNKVMPRPAGAEGWYWSKPAYYLAAAYMRKGLNLDQVQERAERTRQFIRKSALKTIDIVMDFDIKTRGRDGADSRLMTLGRTIWARNRSTSPNK